MSPCKRCGKFTSHFSPDGWCQDCHNSHGIRKPIKVKPVTDYDRTEPMCLMLSRCDLQIIDKHKSDGQDPRDFLQRLISENLRVLRDGTP